LTTLALKVLEKKIFKDFFYFWILLALVLPGNEGAISLKTTFVQIGQFFFSKTSVYEKN
jgi:hypothetical protein